jgi:hypothetical protein
MVSGHGFVLAPKGEPFQGVFKRWLRVHAEQRRGLLHFTVHAKGDCHPFTFGAPS